MLLLLPPSVRESGAVGSATRAAVQPRVAIAAAAVSAGCMQWRFGGLPVRRPGAYCKGSDDVPLPLLGLCSRLSLSLHSQMV